MVFIRNLIQGEKRGHEKMRTGTGKEMKGQMDG